jgi:integrase
VLSRERALVYQTAMKTGLRKDELRKLQCDDVHHDAHEPHIHFRSTANKARREDTIPLDAKMREALAALRPADVSLAATVFSSVPKLATYKKDLARAGIPYRDEQGRQADFHALRMCYNMLLAKKGVAPRVAMQLMRRTDIRLTMKAYTDPTLLDMAGAVAKLPSLSPMTASEEGDQGAAKSARAIPGAALTLALTQKRAAAVKAAASRL